VVLFGAMREVPPVDKPLFERYTDKDLEDIAEFPVNRGRAGGPSAGHAGADAERMERQR
jgi:carboxypeptidase Q